MNTTIVLPVWVQIIIAVPLLVSAVFTMLAALGLMRFDNFYLRMHPTAIVYTLGVWCVCLSSFIFFSIIQEKPPVYMAVIILAIVITMPITTVILARTVLFRQRSAGLPAPPALSYTIVLGELAPIPEKTSEKPDENSDV